MKERVYIEVKSEPWPKPTFWKLAIMKTLYAIFPKANPDFEDIYPEVRSWLLEIELPSGLPRREVGLNETGNPIVAGPLGRNYGFWVDGPEPVEWQNYPKVDEGELQLHWAAVSTKMGGGAAGGVRKPC